MNNSSSRFTVDLAPGISNIPVEDIDGLGIDTSSLPNEQGIPGMPPPPPGPPSFTPPSPDPHQGTQSSSASGEIGIYVTFKKAHFKIDDTFRDWHSKADKYPQPKTDMTIKMLGAHGQTVKSWSLKNASVSSLSRFHYNPNGRAEGHIDEIMVVHEGGQLISG